MGEEVEVGVERDEEREEEGGGRGGEEEEVGVDLLGLERGGASPEEGGYMVVGVERAVLG